MKTYKILNSEERTLTFTVKTNGSVTVYTLYQPMNGDDIEVEETIIIQAVDDGNALMFMNDIDSEMQYHDVDYMHLFLNLIGKFDKRLYDSYIILEPIGQI